MTYTVREIYFTLQGEGVNTGRPAVFCRFSGCNLWSGRESDRKEAICQFCDTQFVGIDGPGGGKFASSRALAEAVAGKWPAELSARRFAVLTGGEPLLQVDEDLVNALHGEGFEIGIETNGTRLAPPGIDWVCVSPKARAPLRLTSGNELKLVFPQAGLNPADLESLAFDHFLLQPMDGADLEENLVRASSYCAVHPQWRLSLQTHKLMGIP
jgi:7-carboxy-7-deazaguanine synthase